MSATLRSHLPQIAAELHPRISEAVKLAAEAVAESAKNRVPVASGDLQRAIHTERMGPAEYAVIAGDENVFYGHLVEHGTSHSPPHPFLVPALEEQRPAVVELVRESLRHL